MEEEKIAVGKKAPRKSSAKPRPKVVHAYELRLRAVKLHEEEGIRRAVIGRELGVSESAISKWVAAYRREGEDGLRSKRPGGRPGQKKLGEAVTARIVELKRQEPSWGVKRTRRSGPSSATQPRAPASSTISSPCRPITPRRSAPTISPETISARWGCSVMSRGCSAGRYARGSPA